MSSNETVGLRRIAVFFALLMAAVVMMAALAAPDVEAKKKKKKKRPPVPAYNVVQCPNVASPDYNHYCDGTPGNDYLIGGPADRSPLGAHDSIQGGEGNDVFNGGDGGDSLKDWAESNDYYLFPSTEFGLRNGSATAAYVDDNGGGADVLDLGSYPSSDFARSKSGDWLVLDGPGVRVIVVYDFFFGDNSIEYFRFSDRTVTAHEIKGELA